MTQAGKVRGFVGLAEDITGRKQAERALQTQARVLASMAEGVIVTDSRGNILYTNPAFDAMFGYEPGELVGRHSTILNSYPPEENSRVVRDVVRQVKKNGVWHGEFHNKKKDGTSFISSACISTLKINEQTPLHFRAGGHHHPQNSRTGDGAPGFLPAVKSQPCPGNRRQRQRHVLQSGRLTGPGNPGRAGRTLAFFTL